MHQKTYLLVQFLSKKRLVCLLLTHLQPFSRNPPFIYPIAEMTIADKSGHKHHPSTAWLETIFEVLKFHAASLKLQSLKLFDIFKIALV